MAVFTVTNLDDAGSGSLRAAITAANSAGSALVIQFAVSGTITLESVLPTISNQVAIDGTSAPGYSSGGAPVVELDCNGNAGLVFGTGSDNSNLLGLSIGDASGNGVTLDAGSITLAGNYIGLSAAGTALGNGGDGVYVAATSSNNTIGYNPTAASGVISNVISGTSGNGITLDGSSDNTLPDNYVGTDPTGTTAIANGSNGIWVTGGASGNTIGGTAFVDTSTGAINDPTGDKGQDTPVFVVPPLGNLVSGNSQNGILIDASWQNNMLNGNFVGTMANSDAALGNTLGGVAIDGADNNSLIGCQFVNNPFVYYNVVSGTAGGFTTFNTFGGLLAFKGAAPNGNDGLLITATGGNQDVQTNVFSGNDNNSIEIGGNASGVTIDPNIVGLTTVGNALLPNGNDGLLIDGTAHDIVVGGYQASVIPQNTFSGNDGWGIAIEGQAYDNQVFNSYVGTDVLGTQALPNLTGGILISDTANNNTIGGVSSGPSQPVANLISGNEGTASCWAAAPATTRS